MPSDKPSQDLVEQGKVVDSGQRRWSSRTGRYEILWIARDQVTHH
jgi:hypothetical protein